MKNYVVDVDITVSKRFYVEASSEEEAKRFVNKLFEKESFYHASNFDAVVGHKIFDVNED